MKKKRRRENKFEVHGNQKKNRPVEDSHARRVEIELIALPAGRPRTRARRRRQQREGCYARPARIPLRRPRRSQSCGGLASRKRLAAAARGKTTPGARGTGSRASSSRACVRGKPGTAAGCAHRAPARWWGNDEQMPGKQMHKERKKEEGGNGHEGGLDGLDLICQASAQA